MQRTKWIGERGRRCARAVGAACTSLVRRLSVLLVGLSSVCVLLMARLYRRIPAFQSLKLKLVVVSSTLALGILAVTYVVLSRSVWHAASREAERHAVQLSDYFSDAMAESVAAKDAMQVPLFAQALLRQGAAAVMIAGADGEVLYASNKAFQPKNLSRGADGTAGEGGTVGTVSIGHETFLQTSRKIRFGERLAGALHVWLNLTELEARMRNRHTFIYPVFAAGFILLIALGIAVLASPFRALKRLTVVADQIGAGDLSIRVPVRGKDEVAHFCTTFNRMVENLSQARAEITRQHLETIQTMISVVEAKDPYTQGHCVRVRNLVRRLLDSFEDLTEEMRSRIETAALLHDIGKIGVPDRVLQKKSPLTPCQSEAIRNHVIAGEKILCHLDSMKDVARWVRHHHEDYNGLGYPDGLRGEAIPFASRVIAVADAIDAMLGDRPYRKAFSLEKALAILKEKRGTQFDPAVIDCAVRLLESPEERRPPDYEFAFAESEFRGP